MDAETSGAARRLGRGGALLLGLFALVYGGMGASIEYGFASDPIGPRGFPVGLGLLLGASAIVYFLKPGEAEALPRGKGLRHAVGLLVLAVACVLAMEWVGFVPAMTVLLAGVAWLFGAGAPMALGSGLGQALLWWAIFGPLLGGHLPKGPLGF